ncbi:5980_t:CDS:10, partial [Cetraspora pellucida]
VDFRKLKTKHQIANKCEEQHVKKQKTLIEKDLRAKKANIPLSGFCENAKCDLLRELPCVICSEMFSSEYWTRISVKGIDLLVLEVDKKFVTLLFDVDFNYKYPWIDKREYKVLLDRDRSLDAGKTLLLSLVNTWIGTVLLCLQELTISEQLLISTGYLCINLIQLTNQQHTYHKLKEHLCDNLKVVFVGQDQLSKIQLKKSIVKIDKIALNSLPEDEVPVALMVTTVMVDIELDNNREAFEHDKYNFTNSSEELRSSGMVCMDNISFAEKSHTLKMLEKMINESNTDDIELALEQEYSKQPITNYAILELLKNVNAVGGKIIADLHSPIVMLYVEKKIDIDFLVSDNFPTVTKRARLAHLDLTAVANQYLTDEILLLEYMTPKTNLKRRMHPSFLPISDSQLLDFEEKFHCNVLAIAKHTLFHKCTWSCDYYTPNKFFSIYLNIFEIYLTKQFHIGKNLPELETSNNFDDSTGDDELEQDLNENCNMNDKVFRVINLGEKMAAVNLRVDYIYYGGNQESDKIHDYKIEHPQCLTHIQVHWSNRNKKVPVLCRKGILHRCKKETILDKQLCQMANRNLEASKLWQIERSVVRYNMSTDNIELLNSQEDSDIKDESSFDLYAIICSGFYNLKLVDEAMLHLHLKDGFKIRNEKLQNSEDIFNKFKPTCKNDNNLIQKWQETIASWKRTEPVNENCDDNHIQEFTYISKHLNYASLQLRKIIKETDLLQEISSDLNDEQKKLFLLVCAGGMGKSKVIKAICKYFDQIEQKESLAVCASLDLLYQDQWARIEYLILDEVSIIGQKLLMQFYTYVKEAKPNWNNALPFAELNIIFLGDFMQLPLKQISSSVNTQTVVNTSGKYQWQGIMANTLTVNICIKDGMTNSAQGILREIVYDDTAAIIKSLSVDKGKSIIIDKPPKYIIIELLNYASCKYDNLPSNHRTQLLVTSAFTFTEFKCQGVILEKAIVDLNDDNIKSGVYVMLSHIQRLQDVMILWPFSHSKLNTTVEPDLRKELRHLEKCFIKTKQLEKWPFI